MNIRTILPFLALSFPFAALAQGNCNNPITLSSVVVSNTQCGVSTGTIIISTSGPIAPYTFEWNPSVSNSNVAINLSAETYAIHIERANNPNCSLDTLVVVNNSNGPQVQANISPAQCLSSNGAISLTPTNLSYHWSTGSLQSSISGLSSQNYYVTVTNPNTGCYSIYKYFVPKDLNGLAVSAQVLENAKCGMSNGKAQILVAGGSGQYTYNPGPGPIYNNLAPGSHPVQVLDLATGCTGSTNIVIQDLPVSGSVSITPHDVKCSGQATGFVEFTVTPGANFELPYVFTLKDANGGAHSPGSLSAGVYTLQIADQDGCTLPAQNFTIHQPPLFNAVVSASPETCASGGQISLSISGGNGGPYIVNWMDLPGDDNPKDRLNLHAGRYSALVYDSLFCIYPVDTVLVQANCNGLSHAHMVLGVQTTDFFCVPAPVGLAPNAVTFSLLGGGLNGSSSYGAWTLNPNGCLSYSAGSIAGFAVDTICIVRNAPSINLKDTTCVVVSITQVPPSKQSVFFPVQVNESATACGTIPPAFTNVYIQQLGRPGLSGLSDTYGAYSIDPVSACLAFFANAATGFNVDEIRVAVFDTLAKKCHIISYFPTILPKNDCSSAASLPDSLHFILNDCNAMATACIPIPYSEIVNYTIIDNNTLYNAGFAGCANAVVNSYNVASLPPGGGPYELTEWKINGQIHTGNFLDINGLSALMTLLDAGSGAWSAQSGGFIRGGGGGNTYGPLKIKSAGGSSAVYNPSLVQVPLGTELRFAPGLHKVVFRNVQTACSDTVTVEVVCFTCPPIHSYPLDVLGGVSWKTTNCNTDTVFCTNIPNAELGQYLMTDNGLPFTNLTLCGNFVGMMLDTGLHQLYFKNTTSTCEWNVRFYLECKNILNEQNIPVSVPLGGVVTVCLDTSLVGQPVSIQNICEEEGNNTIGYSLNQSPWCVQISGQTLGLDTLCIQLCNADVECANYILLVQVSGTPSDSLLAVTDEAFTLKDESIDLNILANDLIGGIAGNISGLSNVVFLSDPVLGAYTYNAATGVLSYTPEAGKCGADSMRYRITDLNGKTSEATIKINIVCDKILIFNGISPNGDGRNDTWTLLGIEQFPNNTVQVYNRWGNLVFEQSGYTNAAAWNGQWKGKDLPDGTYFYLIELGDGAGRMSGWLEILR